MDDFVYDVALSFAGADREPARIIAAIARANGLRVFLDEQYYAESWGRNLNEYLADVYSRSSRYCVILVSQEYCKAAYTNLERRYALDRALASKREYILPVLLDNSWLDGLPTSTAYLDLRVISATEVGAMLVRKVDESNATVTVPAHVPGPNVYPVDGVPGASPFGGPESFSFASLRIADECEGWRESESIGTYFAVDAFRPLPDELGSLNVYCTMGWVTDPIFDVTIMNRAADATVLTAVGVVFVRACISGFGELGGGGTGEPIPLHRTYELPLPDLWSLVAHAHRERNADRMERVDFDEVAMCRLPDPILMQRNQPYRYGLRLFDFMNYCPMTVELRLWARTDLGDVRSRQIRLRYWPGTTPPPMERYNRIRDPEGMRDHAERRAREPYWVRWEEGERQSRQERHERRAYQLWKEAGSPEGNSDLYWHQAELDMLGIYRRPLLASEV
jgi:TIR domain/Protein of unknown function (DUF2934)